MLPGLGQNILGEFEKYTCRASGITSLSNRVRPERRFLADELTLYPSLSMASAIRAAIASLIYGCLFRKLDTEATETPASWATSAIVTLFLPRTVTTLPDFAGDTKTTPLLR